jgi:hypothetical protein
MKSVSLFLVLIIVSASGCMSSQELDPKIRRERLLALYPLGTTSREDVHRKWGYAPHFSIVRPDDGWTSLDRIGIRNHVLNAQLRVNHPVFRCERFVGSDGLMSLCQCWFYFDETDTLVDAEWEWMSD